MRGLVKYFLFLILVQSSAFAEKKFTQDQISQMTMEEVLGEFKEIKGGTFQMGTSIHDSLRARDELAHWVRLSDFKVGATAITQQAYIIVMGENPSHNKSLCTPEVYEEFEVGPELWVGGCHDYPVTNVTWEEGKQFNKKAHERFNKGFRYLTEAEAEYIRRPEYDLIEHWDVDGRVRWLNKYIPYEPEPNATFPVKSKEANGFGVYSSGLGEWVEDFYGDYPWGYFSYCAISNPLGPEYGTERVFRGGRMNVMFFDLKVFRPQWRGSAPSNMRFSDMTLRIAIEDSPSD